MNDEFESPPSASGSNPISLCDSDRVTLSDLEPHDRGTLSELDPDNDRRTLNDGIPRFDLRNDRIPWGSGGCKPNSFFFKKNDKNNNLGLNYITYVF